MISAKIQFDEIQRQLQLLHEKTGNLTPAMRDISMLLESQSRLTFATETDPTGVPWLSSKRKMKWGGKTLTKSGRLAWSIRGAYGKNWAEVGTNVIYARTHQLGLPAKNIPKRAFLPEETDLDWDAIKSIITHYMED